MTHKACSTCGLVKPVSEFYRHVSSRNGLAAQCKACCNARMARWREGNRETSRVHSAASYRRCAQHRAEYGRQYRQANREKRAAKSRVDYAVARGLMARPSMCESCGMDGRKLQAHHENYDKPMDVTWLCGPCHWKYDERRREREAQGE